MYTVIQGIPVIADPLLSQEDISAFVSQYMRICEWEGRQIGKIELISDGQLIHVCTCDRESTSLISVKKSEE